MRRLYALCKRYRFFLLLFFINVLLLILQPQTGRTALGNAWDNVRQMLAVLPPVFVLLGLLDVWVERETMMKYMGVQAGARGALIAFVMGAAAAGPLYAAFPIAGVMLKKGVRLRNVFVFIGTWSTTKIPMLLFEVSSMGLQYTLVRLIGNLIGIACIAWLMERSTDEAQLQQIRERAEAL